ncbi:MAG: PepSY domain-containing protein [Cephaloticoccus sp.]|nr:PepSY domain-containing protein [Cephaloticoccus sp.]MCF7759910.1 PepSY domain-containing protein [Cephaloticoccus sp.]
MTFRKTLFWLHLSAGVVAGLSIFIMCFTGMVLAFEQQLIAFAESDIRRVESAGSPIRLSLAELQERVTTDHPMSRPTGIVVSSDPAAAVVFQLGRIEAFFANPYTGEIRILASTRTHDFMQSMKNWHRWLALGGDNRPIGKAINGVCNCALFLLTVTGLYLWWPRKWRTKGLRRSVWFVLRPADGKARDWNWHNVIGLWSAPILIVLTLTALPISYRWASNLVYVVVGEKPPVRNGPPGATTPAVNFPTPLAGTRPLGLDAILASAQDESPEWEQITLILGGNRNSRQTEPEPPQGPRAVTVTVKTSGSWPRTATTTLQFNPYTAEILQRESFNDLSPGHRLRTWTRFLHTGEALGWVGQLLTGLASLGGCFLGYTGFALVWRRFCRWRKSPTA